MVEESGQIRHARLERSCPRGFHLDERAANDFLHTAADGQENEKLLHGKDAHINKSTQTNEYVDAETSISDSDFDNDATDEYPTLLASST